MVYFTLIFSLLICVNHLSSGETASNNLDGVGDGNSLECEEMKKPGWSIFSLANVTLDAWPDCLFSNLEKASVQKFISDSSANITDATKKGLIGFVQYYVRRNGKECHKIQPYDELLYLAAENGHTNVFKYFARRFVSASFSNKYHDHDWTPLEEAAYLGRYTLLCDGDRSELYGIERATPSTMLMSATRNGHFNIVKYLVGQRRVDHKYTNEQKNQVVHEAVISGSLSIVKYLVEEKEYAVDGNNKDLIGLAAMAGNVDLVKYLVFDKKLNSTTRTKGGETGLHLSALANKLEVVRFFIDTLKWDPFVKNDAKLSPLSLAVLAGHLPIVKYLIEGRNVDLETVIHEENILTTAARCNRLLILKYLTDEKHVRVQTNNTKESSHNPLQMDFFGRSGYSKIGLSSRRKECRFKCKRS